MRRERTGYEMGCCESHRRDERGPYIPNLWLCRCPGESDSLRTEAVNPEGWDHGKTEDKGEDEKSIEPVKTVA